MLESVERRHVELNCHHTLNSVCAGDRPGVTCQEQYQVMIQVGVHFLNAADVSLQLCSTHAASLQAKENQVRDCMIAELSSKSCAPCGGSAHLIGLPRLQEQKQRSQVQRR